MYEQFGARVDGQRVTFRLFFPDVRSDEGAYRRGGLPNISTVRVVGTFQEQLGDENWDPNTAPELKPVHHSRGLLYQCELPVDLPEGFYEYKYVVTYPSSTQPRWCADPCTRYGGYGPENSGFAVGGNDLTVRPLARRLPPKDLVIYELMPDDFTAEFRGTSAPFDAIRTKIPYLKALGINAVEFMPWTAWPGSEFNWGYEPFSFFSVEHRYMADRGSTDPADDADKLVRLKRLIDELHKENIHVIMDGVFNHVSSRFDVGAGFGYATLYERLEDSPFVGNFSGVFPGLLDLDFGNNCTQEFVFDACRYWIDQYEIDGIRFDYTLGYFGGGSELGRGIVRLCDQVAAYCHAIGRENMSLMLEHLTDNRYQAIDDTNHTAANGCWFDPLFYESQHGVDTGRPSGHYLRTLNAAKDFSPGKRPVTYIENHDHFTLTVKAGGRHRWWRTQPFAIGLLTAPGSVLIHNGQEFGQYEYFEEPGGEGRVNPRPLRWAEADDEIGTRMRELYAKLIKIRHDHPALRSRNFYPDSADPVFNHAGFGVDSARGLVIFHRWDTSATGGTDYYTIVLNCGTSDQSVDIPFRLNGTWDDLLNDSTDTVTDNWLRGKVISANWGRIYHRHDP